MDKYKNVNCHSKPDNVTEALSNYRNEIDILRSSLGESLKTWRHMVNCGITFHGEYRDKFTELYQIAKLNEEID